jgi:hypothetical protein
MIYFDGLFTPISKPAFKILEGQLMAGLPKVVDMSQSPL